MKVSTDAFPLDPVDMLLRRRCWTVLGDDYGRLLDRLFQNGSNSFRAYRKWFLCENNCFWPKRSDFWFEKIKNLSRKLLFLFKNKILVLATMRNFVHDHDFAVRPPLRVIVALRKIASGKNLFKIFSVQWEVLRSVRWRNLRSVRSLMGPCRSFLDLLRQNGPNLLGFGSSLYHFGPNLLKIVPMVQFF